MPARSTEEAEVWENATQATVTLRKIGARGEDLDVIVAAGSKIKLTAEEREVNMELAGDRVAADPFRNGMLRPLTIVSDADPEVADTGVWLGESEMLALLKAHHKTFDAALAKMTSAVVLERFLQVAREANAGVRAVERITECFEAARALGGPSGMTTEEEDLGV